MKRRLKTCHLLKTPRARIKWKIAHAQSAKLIQGENVSWPPLTNKIIKGSKQWSVVYYRSLYRYSSIQLKIQENTYTIVFHNTGKVLLLL